MSVSHPEPSVQTIVIAAHEFPPIAGGAGRFAEAIASGLAGSGLRVIVATPQRAEGEEGASYERRAIAVPRPTVLAYLAWRRALIHLAAAEPSAVILATDILTQRACALLPKHLRRRCAILAHGSEVLANFAERWPKRPLYTRLYHDVPVIVANSRYTQQLLTRHGVDARKVHVVHPWLEPQWWEGPPEPGLVLNRFGLSAARVILTVGRLSRRKRQDAVIRALPRVLQRVPDAAYLLVGSGEQEPYLRSLAQECGVAERVFFAGSVRREELMGYYDACSVFVMPSQRTGPLVEGFGIAFLEAQARGKPVVAGRESGAEEAIRDGATGRLIDPDATEELAETMSTLLSDRSLADEMGRAGRRHVAAQHNGAVIERLCALLVSGGRLTSAWKETLPSETDPFQLTETAHLPRYNHWIMDKVRPFVGQSVMEIGAGIGNLSSQLVDRRRLVVTDVAEPYLWTLRARFVAYPNLEIRRFSLQEPIPDDMLAAFDTVICVNVLEHVEHDREALSVIRSLLRPGGHLLLFVPAFQWLFGPIDTALGHFRRYHRRPLLALLQASGFEITQCSYFNLVGVAGWFLNSRILRRSELPAWQFRCYDALVPWLRRVERLTGAPIGQSLIAVARRSP
jgi:phosphatidylinositol alpha-1,6-mannosyltransferase